MYCVCNLAWVSRLSQAFCSYRIVFSHESDWSFLYSPSPRPVIFSLHSTLSSGTVYVLPLGRRITLAPNIFAPPPPPICALCHHYGAHNVGVGARFLRNSYTSALGRETRFRTHTICNHNTTCCAVVEHSAYATAARSLCMYTRMNCSVFVLFFSGGKFISIGEKIRLPDDVTMGYIIGEYSSQSLQQYVFTC
jgi:hypothetical protein